MREHDVRPDFARGIDEENDRKDERRFSEGQERRTDDHEKEHGGTFGEGQAEQKHHPEGALPGRFSRGQEDREADV